MTNKTTQQQAIIDYAKSNPTFTIRDIFDKCFVNSPTARMSELYKLGYVFEKTWVESNDGAKYLTYRLIAEPKGVA